MRNACQCAAALAVVLLLAITGRAVGVIVNVDSVEAVRLLAFPDNNSLHPGHYQVGGIDGNGNVFGMAASNRDDRHHVEDPVIWKRVEGYEPQVVWGGKRFTPSFAFNLDQQFVAELNAGAASAASVSQPLKSGL